MTKRKTIIVEYFKTYNELLEYMQNSKLNELKNCTIEINKDVFGYTLSVLA